MDPKLFAQQGINMNSPSNQPNPNMMLQFQQQQLQQQQQAPDMQQFNPLMGAGMPFNAANLGGGLNFGQQDFGGLDQTDLTPFIQGMNGINMASLHQQQQQQQQQQQLRQNPQMSSAYSPQNLMNLQANSPAALQAQFQNRGMYSMNGNMMPNTPQALMFQQQQQQQAAMAVNRAKNSPSQSPALNNTHFPNNNVSSPVVANSPHMSVGKAGSDYAASPMNPNIGSPIQTFQQGNGISPSPQMTRVIPSQGNSRYLQQMNAQSLQQQQTQQQNMNSASPSLHNPSVASYASPQLQQQDNKTVEAQTPKSYNTTMSGYVQQSPMQAHASPIPRQSVTPGSTHSTPRQQYQQLDTTPHVSPTTSNNNMIHASPSPKPTDSTDITPANISSTKSEHATPSSTPQTPQQQITYIPKTRNVDTYGGIDLKYFDKFEIKPPVPHISELGLVDIQALILSLKSGLKMEITNALNILTVLTIPQPPMQHQQQPSSALPLQNCDELLDVLLDLLEQDILGTCKRFDEKKSNKDVATEKKVASGATYTDLFDMSLDEMKSLIPELEKSSSDNWLSLRDRCLCVLNILRNLSFMGENVQFLAKHVRFIDLMADLVDETRDESIQKEAWYVGIRHMDRLDFRKSILMMFANLSMLIHLRTKKNAIVVVDLVYDFMVNGPDTYYSLLAIETWTKLTVNHENRQLLHSLITNETVFQSIADIWLELASVIQRDFFSYDGRVMHAMTSNQLATLELTMIGLYNVLAIVQNETVKQDLAQRNKSLGMMIIRLSVTLAESGNAQFGLVTKRGMELIRSIVCGGDGIRRRQRQQQPGPLDALNQPNQTQQEKEERDYLSPSEIGHLILDMPVLREKLMLSLLKPTTDPEILRELSDIVNSIDENSIV